MQNYESSWEARYSRLLDYRRVNGNVLVPASYKEKGFNLGSWVGYMRTRYRRGLLSEERIKLLNEVPGWEWGPLRTGPRVDFSLKDRNREILEMKESGKSLTEIGKHFDITKQRVHQILKEISI